MTENAKKWFFCADRGGTFTDVIGISPQNTLHTVKLLSQSKSYLDASIEGVKRILKAPLTATQISNIKLATTIATNALLERTGTPVTLITTQGFGDLLSIGYQNRPKLFSLNIEKTKPLFKKTIEIKERIDANGKVHIAIDKERVYQQLQKIEDKEQTALAIVFLHSWTNPKHEQQVANIAKELGFAHVYTSATALIKAVSRGQTTVVNAYLNPILQKYIKNIEKQTKGITIKFMQSNGGLSGASSFVGKDAILSGPAGGVIGFSHIAKSIGFNKVIGFDMGGTSTDVSRFDGHYEKVFQTQIAGIPIQADMLHVATVAAGGGSILHFDGHKMMTGPDSAGAMPGPLSYGLNGPLTVTDANLLCGVIVSKYFPKVFGKNNCEGLKKYAVEQKFQELAKEISEKTDMAKTPYEVAEGFIKIANENMSNAIKKISIAKGFDTREYALFCFGGAGAQHACAIARLLNISRIILHPLGGVLSAYGIAVADVIKTDAKSVLCPFNLPETGKLQVDLEKMAKKLEKTVIQEGIAKKEIETLFFLDIRPKGTESAKTILWTTFEETRDIFFQEYFRHYGIEITKEKALEVVNIRAEVVGKQQKPQEQEFTLEQKTISATEALDTQEVYFEGKFYTVPVHQRDHLQPGNEIIGPAIVLEKYSTVFIEPDFKASMNSRCHLILSLCSQRNRIAPKTKDPIMLEIFNNLFMNIAEQMGATLINTAYSTNIKERLDFSCAVFDKQGYLVANAPHIPVHLGAMGETVQNILANNKLKPQDVYISNNPFAGGSHLPDITVVTPVFKEEELVFFVASRGHHADIGGISPGSMPPFSSCIEEEGIVFDNFKVIDQGVFCEQKVISALKEGKYPARNISERISDLQAQIAANHKGSCELLKMVEHYGLVVVKNYMEYIQENAADATRVALGKFLTTTNIVEKKFIDFLDEGARICVVFTISKGENPPHSHRATINFDGTSKQLLGNLNAPLAVVKAAVLYVLRTLIEKEIPLNAGCLIPINIKVPDDCLLNPGAGAAVVGGNVETSQRVVDVLYGALGVVAASQGTMNNFTFGKEGKDHFGYYETICGGSGAGPNFHGTDAVHTHMTNTRITDPEILENRYPQVRLEEFSIRRGSGGKGKFYGGNGVIRRMRFLQEQKVSILSQRRGISPYGLAGGGFGKQGKNTITYQNGLEQALPAKVFLNVQPGEMINIYTPGGGGYGKMES